jgi:hypothetical protein
LYPISKGNEVNIPQAGHGVYGNISKLSPYAKKRSYKGMVVMHKLYENLDLSHQSSNSI